MLTTKPTDRGGMGGGAAHGCPTAAGTTDGRCGCLRGCARCRQGLTKRLFAICDVPTYKKAAPVISSGGGMVMTLIRAQRWGLGGVAGLVLALTLAAGPAMAGAGRYVETDLASDIQGRAQNLDTSLVNPWGLVRGPSTPWWSADNGVGQS